MVRAIAAGIATGDDSKPNWQHGPVDGQGCGLAPATTLAVRVHRGDRENFLRPVVGWRVDVPWCQDPQPVWVFLFEVFSDLLIVV
jgi:hypothetical protein